MTKDSHSSDWIFYFLDSLGYPAFVVDANKEVLAANSSLRQIQCPREDCPVKEFKTLLGDFPHYRPKEEKCLFCDILFEKNIPFTETFETEYGNTIWRCHCYTLSVGIYLIYALEITNEKSAEKKFLSNTGSVKECKLFEDISFPQGLLPLYPDPFFTEHFAMPVLGLRKGKIVKANKEFWSFSGYEKNRVLGREFRKFLSDVNNNAQIDCVIEGEGEALFLRADSKLSVVKYTNVENVSNLNLCRMVVLEVLDKKKEEKDKSSENGIPGSNASHGEGPFSEADDANTDSFEKIQLHPAEDLSLDLKVLYVEDKYVNRKVMKLMLETLGCHVHLAENGSEGLQVYEDFQDFDIILMDIQMPVMDGISAVKELKALYKDLPPVIAVTAFVDVANFAGFDTAGFCDVVYKPVCIDNLLEKLIYWSQKS